MQDVGQILIQLPIVGAFIWYTIKMVDKFEIFALKMQDDQQDFIVARDATYSAMMERFGAIIERNTEKTNELAVVVKESVDAKRELVKKLEALKV